MALGVRIGAGGVQNLYRCYVGAGGVKEVTGIYIGQGGSVRKVWPSGLIYDTGMIYEPMTWYDNGESSTEASYTTLTYDSSYMLIERPNGTSGSGSTRRLYWLITQSAFDMSMYSTLSMTFQVTRYGSTNHRFLLGVGSNSRSSESDFDASTTYTYASNNRGVETITTNISSVTSSRYVKLCLSLYGNTVVTMNIQKIELS